MGTVAGTARKRTPQISGQRTGKKNPREQESVGGVAERREIPLSWV